MNKIENLTSVGNGINTDKDVYIFSGARFVLWIFGIGGNLLVFAHQNMSNRKCLTVPMSALSSFDFLLCCILATILFSNPNQWFSVKIRYMDQILFTRLIVMYYYFILWITIRIGKSLHNVSQKVLSIFHACIVMPLFVLCIFKVNNSQTSQGTKETILHCRALPRKAYGIFTICIAIGSCLACIGMTVKKKYIIKNTYTFTENGRIGIITEDVENHNQTLVTRHSERDSRTFTSTSNVNISTGKGNMPIVFGVIYHTLFSGIVLHNAMKHSGNHDMELRKGLTHNIILILGFLQYDCATPLLSFLFDKTFRNFIAKCIRCRKPTLSNF